MLSKVPLFRIEADLGEITEVGATPYGGRRVIEILGGRVSGARLSGRILSGGADWQILRSDGVADIQARYVIETDAGARVLVRSDGLRHGPPGVLDRIAAGEKVDPSLYYFRTALRFEASVPELAWMNRAIFLGFGERERVKVTINVHELL
jgi:hypothetical protein